jgi:hypothetical protein
MAIAAAIGAQRHMADRDGSLSLADHIAKAAFDWAIIRDDMTNNPRPIHPTEPGGPTATIERRVSDDGFEAVYIVAAKDH